MLGMLDFKINVMLIGIWSESNFFDFLFHRIGFDFLLLFDSVMGAVAPLGLLLGPVPVDTPTRVSLRVPCIVDHTINDGGVVFADRHHQLAHWKFTIF